MPVAIVVILVGKSNDEHMHHYQRRRASITGFGLQLRTIIETERLVVVA